MRWLLALVAIVLVAAFVAMGIWQLRVYDDHQRASVVAVLDQRAAPLDSVLGPDAALDGGDVGRPVVVRGRYLADEQVYARHLPGSTARFAVVTPLLTASGSAVLVVRGSTDVPRATVPKGTVRVRGVLEPPTPGGPPNARGIASGISVASLVNAVRPDLYAGYVLQRGAQHPPGATAELQPVAPQLPDPSGWAGLRNLVYAVQWWVFAGFVVFMWWRIALG